MDTNIRESIKRAQGMIKWSGYLSLVACRAIDNVGLVGNGEGKALPPYKPGKKRHG
jgi:hypothetical protein